MEMVVLLAIVFIGIFCQGSFFVYSSSIGPRSRNSENREVPYPKYPSCRRGREYAIPVQERVDGRSYFERRRSDGKVKYYLCSPCTVCEDYGIATRTPCTERSNTECSTDCIVPGCVFDEVRNLCSLHPDLDLGFEPEAIGNAGLNMNPCSAPVTSSVPVLNNQTPLLSDKGPEISTDMSFVYTGTSREEISNQANSEGSILTSLQSSEDPNTPAYGFVWAVSEALFVGIAIVLAVVVVNVFAILYIRQKNRTVKKKRRTRDSTDSLHAAMARARSDSNVDGKNKDVVFV